MAKTGYASKRKREKRFTILLYIVMVLIMIITVYPMWFSVINSFNNPDAIARDGYALLFPRKSLLRVGSQC